MNIKNKVIIHKLAKIVDQQQKIIDKLAQQVVDTSHQSDDPLGKLIHDATMEWVTKNRMSAKSNFSAGIRESIKKYDVEVILEITDPRKPGVNTPAFKKIKEKFTQDFFDILKSMFNTAAQNKTSPLFGYTAIFNIIVK